MPMTVGKADQANSNLEDICLIAAFIGGRRSAFDDLFRKYQNQLFSLCYRFLECRTEAEDAVQEAFLDIYSGLRGFRGNAAFRTWAYRITVRRCYTRIGRRKTHAPLPDELAVSSESPEHNQVDRIAVRQGLSKLPDACRMLLVLKYYQQLSYEDIGAMLSCDAALVKARLRRARLRLKDVLEKEMEGESL